MNIKQDLLKRARARLALGQSNMICFAIARAAHDTPEHRQAAQELKDLVSERLEGQITLSSWLRFVKFIHIPYVEVCGVKRYTNETQAKLLETRLAWMDSLIEEFK